MVDHVVLLFKKGSPFLIAFAGGKLQFELFQRLLIVLLFLFGFLASRLDLFGDPGFFALLLTECAELLFFFLLFALVFVGQGELIELRLAVLIGQ